MFYRITVRGVCRKWKGIDVIISQKVSRKTCSVGTGIILEKRDSWTLTKHWNDNGSKNSINILSCGLAAVYDHKLRLESMVYCPPHNYTTFTEAIMLQDTIIRVTFMTASIYSNTTIGVGQVELDSSLKRQYATVFL